MASLASPLAPLARPLAAMTHWRRPIYLGFQGVLLAGALAAAKLVSDCVARAEVLRML